MNKTFSNKAGNLILELRQDTMSAWLTIKRSGKIIDETDIMSLIDEAGIRTGFEEAQNYIREHSLVKDFGVPFPIAICNIQENASTLRYHFSPDLQINLGAGINFHELEKISYVEAGSVVADYSSNLFEQDGSIYDIFGELINPSSVDEAKAVALAGDNVSYNSNNREFVADKTGYPHLDEQGRINVLDVIVLNGEDIPGNLNFRTPLDLLVQGNLACANLYCGGNVTIKGDIHSSSIYCAKDLHVEGEIIACNGNGIQTMGLLNCMGMRDSKILCRRQLRFSGRIENCNIACDGEILGDPANSEICGGLTQSGGSISIANAGSDSGVATDIEIAISPFYRALLMQLTRELIRLKDDSEGNALAIAELQNRIKSCEGELDDELNTFLKRPAEEKKSINILLETKPLTNIRVLKHSYPIKNTERGLELVEKE